jgi:hypothetical protein
MAVKYSKEALETYLKNNPLASYDDLIDVFNGSCRGLNKAFQRYGLPFPRPCHRKYDRDSLETYLLSHPYADYDDIARFFKTSRNGVYNALIRHGLRCVEKPSPDHLIKYHRQELEHYIVSHPNWTYATMARFFKGSSAGVREAVKRYDLPCPTYSEMKKYSHQALKAYISDHPQATKKEIAVFFGGTYEGIKDALRRYRIESKV